MMGLLYVGRILGCYGDTGKEAGNHYSGLRVILRICRDNGQENGNYYIIYWGYMQIMENGNYYHGLYTGYTLG